MSRLKPSPATKAMLVSREIALWDAHHYTTAASAHPGRPTAKDPISVVLVSPRFPDRHFHGHGPDIESAIRATLSGFPELVAQDVGLTGAMGRLSLEINKLERALRWALYDPTALDDDIPF